MRARLGDLTARLGGRTGSPDVIVTGFATDSREVRPGDIFIAIRGGRVDGHDFVRTALTRGAAACLVETPVAGPNVLVPNVTEALAEMARSFRAEFDGPVVGITGSAGKTTAKEFCAAALSTMGPVLKTEANRNTEITGPLIWADVPEGAKSAVIEMGMRGLGQIAHLASFAKPTIGVVTNIGWSHVELLGSRENIAVAKGELFEALPKDGIPIAWAEDEYLWALISAAGDRELRTFGFGGNADLQITDYIPVSWTETRLEGVCDGKTWTATIPAAGRHVALSVAAGLLAAVSAGADLDAAAEALSRAELPPLRMEIRKLLGATFVVDTYNASPPAMVASLDALAEMPTEGRRLAVLGHMRELGDEAAEAHREVGAALARSGAGAAILYGPLMEDLKSGATGAGMDPARIAIAPTLDAVREMIRAVRPGDTVLVKASRALELERALEGLS